MASITVGSARIDENGNTHGGTAGDQTGKEVSTQAYYLHSKSWRVFRAKASTKRTKIGTAMKRACNNNKIGYDQYERNTLYTAAKKVGFDPQKVTTKVETDCSALVRVCCAYAGITLSDFNTSSEASTLLNSGKFKEVTSTINLNTGAGLAVGDILVTKTKGHTVVVTAVSGTSKPSYTKGKTYTTQVDKLRVRTGAGTSYSKVAYKDLTANAKANAYSNGTLKKGTKVTCKSTKNVGNNVWMKIPSGWVCAYKNGDTYIS